MEYSRLAVLNVYKSLLRYANNINLTDKDFYLRVIRQEFKKYCNVVKPEERLRLIQVGQFDQSIKTNLFSAMVP